MKALKARAAAHCTNADRRKVTTQTTAFLREIVQHLPDSPMQGDDSGQSGHSAISQEPYLSGEMLRETQERMPWAPLSQYPAPESLNGKQFSSLRAPNPPASPSAPLQQPARNAEPASDPAAALTSTPRGQKRARDDTLRVHFHLPPLPRRPVPRPGGPQSIYHGVHSISYWVLSISYQPIYSQSICHGTHAPPFTPSPSPRKSTATATGAAYLSNTFRARRSAQASARGNEDVDASPVAPRRASVLPFGPLGLDVDEIPRFLDGI
ncbi:hypothetical protein DFH09DRAFT_1367390 [Mycena vulgaris]|nr:hypothetical protein DFH09DRAFT_1367390 [Mycena vulgaris]